MDNEVATAVMSYVQSCTCKTHISFFIYVLS